MEIKEIFDHMEKIGFLTFSTIEDGSVHSRIAHFYACDEDGLYLRTMFSKPFYRQMIKTGKLSVCGMYPHTRISGHDENGVPDFPPGYTLRITGDVRELSEEEVQLKAEKNSQFKIALFDMEKYPATRNLIMYRGKGEIYDFDFEMVNRDHKLLRKRFSFGGMDFNPSGSIITDKCVECGECYEVCTFKAIVPGSPYRVIGERCDECASCILVCPEEAIIQPGTI
ncbi:4Fe-4S binding protein [Thermodesulfobacteriota bacterium]